MLVQVRFVGILGGDLSPAEQFAKASSKAKQSSTMPTTLIVFIAPACGCRNVCRVGNYLRCYHLTLMESTIAWMQRGEATSTSRIMQDWAWAYYCIAVLPSATISAIPIWPIHRAQAHNSLGRLLVSRISRPLLSLLNCRMIPLDVFDSICKLLKLPE